MVKMNYLLNTNFKVVKDENINVETFLHSKRVAAYTKKIAHYMNYGSKQTNTLILAALSHDIGKSRIPSNILNKKDSLTNFELEIVKQHAQYGVDILMENKHSKNFCDIIRFHHENYDGSGYNGLYQEQIPIDSRIIRIVDVFDALTSNRSYRNAYSIESALEIMECEKHMYDPKIFEVFIRVVDENIKEMISKNIS